jgi:excisionase family DNA binding protein
MKPMLLKAEEAALILGVSRSTAYALIARGDIPSVNVGSRVRVPVEALREWVARQSKTSNQ